MCLSVSALVYDSCNLMAKQNGCLTSLDHGEQRTFGLNAICANTLALSLSVVI